MPISNEIFEDYRTEEQIKALCKMYPNDQELGKHIRYKFQHNDSDRKKHSNKTN